MNAKKEIENTGSVDLAEKDFTYISGKEEIKLTVNMVRKFLLEPQAKPTDAEIVIFLQLCKFRKLNPFLKDAYLIKFGNYPASNIVAKHVFEQRADRHPQYDGKECGIYVADKDGVLQRRNGVLILPNETIVAGWCKVYRKDRAHVDEICVPFGEYAKKNAQGKLNSTWSAMPGTMIRKVADVQGLREAFPDDFAGMYIKEEIDQARLPGNTYDGLIVDQEEAKTQFDKLIDNSETSQKPAEVPVKNVPNTPASESGKIAPEAEEFFRE